MLSDVYLSMIFRLFTIYTYSNNASIEEFGIRKQQSDLSLGLRGLSSRAHLITLAKMHSLNLHNSHSIITGRKLYPLRECCSLIDE